MNNIHVLPTDKPSRLVLDTVNNNLFLTTTKDFGTNIMKFQNIYITSDEKPKQGDWHFKNDKMVTKSHLIDNTCKKIILTTDQDLVKDGVQAIDDEFLEWFVKNPTCEEIEIIYGLFNPMGRQVDPMNLGQNHSECVWEYKIILPAEERERGITITNISKLETLEQANKKSFGEIWSTLTDEQMEYLKDYIDRQRENAKKWQAERMYSEEDLKEAFIEGYKQRAEKSDLIFDNASRMYAIHLFEQFKKK